MNKSIIPLVEIVSTLIDQCDVNTTPVIDPKCRAIIDYIDEVQKFRAMLSDLDSVHLLDKIIAARLGSPLLGFGRSYELNGPMSQKVWKEHEQKAKSFKVLKGFDDEIKDRTGTFFLEAYNYANICVVEEGDIVIDGGAYTGNSCYYFSKLASSSGKVYGFEASPSTFEKLKYNVEGVLANVVPVAYGLSDNEGTAFITGDSFGAQVTSEGNIEIKLTSIDRFVENENLPRVDFIKMDVEGSESAALCGAIETITKFHPKMAICLYHKPNDLFELPFQISKIYPKYDFYLKHNHFGPSETVLFCNPRSSRTDNVIPEVVQSLSHITLLYEKFIQVLRKSKIDALLLGIIDLIKTNQDIPQCIKKPTAASFLSVLCFNDPGIHFEIFVREDNYILIGLHLESKNSITGKIEDYIKKNNKLFSNGIPYNMVNKHRGFFFEVSLAFDKSQAQLCYSILVQLIKNSAPLFDNFGSLLTNEAALHYLKNKSAH